MRFSHGRRPASPPPTAGELLGNQHANLQTQISSANVATMKPAWFVPTSGLVSSTPLVWQSSVIFSDWSGRVWRVNTATGKVLWKVRLESPDVAWPWYGFAGTGVIAGDTLVEASVEGQAWGLSAATGKLLWTVRLTSDGYAGNLSDLLYDGSRVYLGMSSVDEPLHMADHTFVMDSCGSVIALDPATGRQLWQTSITQAPDSGGAVWSSLAVDPSLGLLFCDTGNNYTLPATDLTDAVLALHTDTGAVAWHEQVTSGDAWPAAGPDDDFGAGPQLFTAISGGSTAQLVGAMQKQGVYWVFDEATGAPVWHATIGTGFKDSDGEASVGAGRIFAWADSRSSTSQPVRATVMALDAASGRRLWVRSRAQGRATAAAGFLSDNVYLVGDKSGHVQAYRASDGKTLWTGLTSNGLGAVSSLWAQGTSLYVGVGSRSHAGLEAFRVR